MSSTGNNAKLPVVSVLVNGSPLPVEAEPCVTSVAVESDVTVPSMFTIELNPQRDRSREMQWIDDELFAIGTAVEVKMGYGSELSTLITGEITGLEPFFIMSAGPRLIVRGYDRRHRLLRGRKSRTFSQQKDSDIASAIAAEAGLTAGAEDSQVVHDHVFQANQTNMEFLQSRARRINYEVAVDGSKLLFRPAKNAESEILTLKMEDDVLEFFPRLSTMRQVTEFEVTAWDPKQKKAIKASSKVGDEVSLMGGQQSGGDLSQSAFGDAVGKVGDRPVMTQAEADQYAAGGFNSAALALISGSGICRGRGDLQPGKVIKIDGLGTRFSGQYYVTAALHRYTPRLAYHTEFFFRRNAV